VIVLNIGCSARPPPRCPTGQGRSVRAATSGTHPLGQAWDTPPNTAAWSRTYPSHPGCPVQCGHRLGSRVPRSRHHPP